MNITNQQIIDVLNFIKTKNDKNNEIRVSELQIKFLRGFNWGDKMMSILEEYKVVRI